jgi:nitroreductase
MNTTKMDVTGITTNEVITNILSRRSVRKFLSVPVEKEKTDLLLRAGMQAPSAVNKQPWHFVVVDNPAVKQQIIAKSPNGGTFSTADQLIIVCGDLTKKIEGDGSLFWIIDCSAPTENILLAAHGLGLGAVWTGAYSFADYCSMLSTVLHLPEHIMPFAVIAVGYAENEREAKSKWDQKKVSYNTFKYMAEKVVRR